MNIGSRIERVEQQMGLGRNARPFILVVTPGPARDDAGYEARLRQRIEETIRRHPNDRFRLLL